MPGSFHLELDTTAPTISFGTPTNTVAGELLTVPYSLTDAGPASGISATVTLADARVLTMTIGPTAATVLLPADTPAGAAHVDLVARDELLNEATGTLVIALSGTIVVPEPTAAPPGGPPAGRAPRRPLPISAPEMRRLDVRSTVHATSTSSLTTAAVKTATAIPGSQAAVIGRMAPPRTVITASSTAGARGLMLAAGASRATTAATVRRADGPDDVAALLALGLL